MDIKYVGQNTALTIPVTAGAHDRAATSALAERFSAAHLATFGYRSDDERLQVVALKVIARGVHEGERIPERFAPVVGERVDSPSRHAYFGPDHGWLDTPVLAREALTDTPRRGPLIVEEYDSTTVIPPEWSVARDRWGNLSLALS